VVHDEVGVGESLQQFGGQCAFLCHI
jgi:hypothetical protein